MAGPEGTPASVRMPPAGLVFAERLVPVKLQVDLACQGFARQQGELFSLDSRDFCPGRSPSPQGGCVQLRGQLPTRRGGTRHTVAAS